jgi:hypothetical protein
MKVIEMRIIEYTIVISILCLVIFLTDKISKAEESTYPIKIEIIEQNQATYSTIENTISAIYSAFKNENLEWIYQTLTKKSAEEHKNLFEEADIDPKKIFELNRSVKNTFILDKIMYKEAIILIIEDHHQNGNITKYPMTFVKENEKWKQTNKFSDDEKLWDYIEYIKPEEILSSSIIIYPNRWNHSRHTWIKEHINERTWIKNFAERVCVLCIIGNLKDNAGNPRSVEDILPETLLLNYVVRTQPWRFGQEVEEAVIFDLKKGRDFKEIHGFKAWRNRKGFTGEFVGPVLLAKFNKFKAMETLPEIVIGKDYDITVSGQMKDGTRFKGCAEITVTEWKAGHGRNWKNPNWLNSGGDADNWWNK